MTAIYSFLASFIYLFLLSVQTVNVVDKNIPAIGLTSVGVSVAWLVMIRCSCTGWKEQGGLIVGAALGAMVSVPFHTWLTT